MKKALFIVFALFAGSLAYSQELLTEPQEDILFVAYANDESAVIDMVDVKVNSWGNQEEIFKICASGEIYWRGRLVTTDKQLTDAFRDVVIHYRCPECRRRLGERYIPDTKNP